MIKQKLILLDLLFLSAHIHALPPGVKHIEVPFKAPDINLIDTDGHKHTLADYQGSILIVNFWGIWCQPCRKEMPSLQRAYEQLIKENITIIAITMDDSIANIIQYKNKNPVDFALLSDKENIVSTNWSIPVLPTSYIINQKGEIIIRIIGEYEWDNAKFLEEIKLVFQQFLFLSCSIGSSDQGGHIDKN